MESIKDFYFRYLRYFLAKDDATATTYDKYLALSYAVRSRMVDGWIASQKDYHINNVRRVYYLSMEYVMGRSLRQNVVNLGIEDAVEEAARDLGFSLEELEEQEDDFELGNGGKGRLAASFQDSIASRALPGMGYGLRYDYGYFRQKIHDGMQTENPYDWLHRGHPWEIIRPEYGCEIGFEGACRPYPGSTIRKRWVNTEKVLAVPYDLPVPGYINDTVNTLRLWSARASEIFPSDYPNHSDYVRACQEKSRSGEVTKVLFPEEDVLRSTEERLKQQYFFVCASLQDIMRRFDLHNPDLETLADKVVIQLNGSRCALAVPEMMRILVDERGVSWKKAWKITQAVFAYTSHAVAGDDLESWPVYMVESLFPRHLQIIYAINQRHLEKYRGTGGSDEGVRELSLIEEGEVKRIRMAHLGVVGCSTVNGVSRAQTEMLRTSIFGGFHRFYTDRIRNITNGVAHRRWMLCANRPLASLITEAIGESWLKDPASLEGLLRYENDIEFLHRLMDLKHSSKRALADILNRQLGVALDTMALFDVQCKKIHPYKRQLLHLLNVLTRYLRIKDGRGDVHPRVHLFAGKASPSDRLPKQIVQLITSVADLVNNDPRMKNRMQVVFVPDYGISWAERMIPAADLSEQISTVHLEACGTANMKFALNGAVTVAARAGSNIEMIEMLGDDDIFVFGRAVEELPAADSYHPWELVEAQPELSRVLDFLEKHLARLPSGYGVYPLLSTTRDVDEYFVLLDYADYVAAQDRIDETYPDRTRWAKASLRNIARMGWFSTDRTVGEYARDIWKVSAL